MRHFSMLCNAIILSSGLAAAASPLFGYVAPAANKKLSKVTVDEGMKVLRPSLTPDERDTKQQKSDEPMLSRDDVNGTVRLISGKLGEVSLDKNGTRSLSQAFVDTAESFLRNHPENFYAEGLSYRLNKEAMHISESEQFISFDVLRNNKITWDAHVDFRFKFGKLVQVQNFSFAETQPPKKGLVSRTELKKKVINTFGVNAKYKRDVVRIIAHKDSYAAETMAEFSFTLDNEAYLAQVSYETGDIFQYYHTNFYGSGTAGTMVYGRSWVEDAEPLPFPFLNIAVPNSTARTDNDGAFSFTGSTTPSINGLSGTRVKVVPYSGTSLKLAGVKDEGSEDNFKIFFTPASTSDRKTDKLMAQAMAYVHINRIVTRASQFINPTWFSKALTANVNVNNICNAMWDGTDVNFYAAGSNCANTALSSDIVYHEWGHGLDANTGGIVDSAFSEGYGDIMALVMNHSPDMGEGFYLNGKGLRELRTIKVYPRDRGEIHAEGLIIGSTFYGLLEALTAKYGEADAREALAKYAFKVIYTAKRYTDVYNALLVIDDDDANLANMTPNFCLINKVFTAHGLAKNDERCTEEQAPF